jgi:ABC-2 type transport system ATP-binding protein
MRPAPAFGKLRARRWVSFKAYPGQVMGFIGPNGAGKTTAMRILATLDVPTAGEAFINGYSVVDDPDKVRRIVGFMPDSFGKYANMDVVEYVDFFARAYGLSGDVRRDAVERVLVFTELRKLANKPIRPSQKGCRNGWRWGEHWSTIPRCWCSTNRPPGWTPGRGSSCGG